MAKNNGTRERDEKKGRTTTVWNSCCCRRRQSTEKLMLKRNRNEWAELMGILSAFSNAEFSWSKLSAGCNVRAMHRQKCFKCTVMFCRLTILFYFSAFSFDSSFTIWLVSFFNWHESGSGAIRKLILSEVFIKYKISGKNLDLLVGFIAFALIPLWAVGLLSVEC